MRYSLSALFCLAAAALTPFCTAAQTTQPQLHPSQDDAINVACKLADTKTALSNVTDPAKKTVLINTFNNCVSSHESLGTKITAKRLELINSLNMTDFLIEYKDLKNANNKPIGTVVTVTIPIKNVFDTNLNSEKA